MGKPDFSVCLETQPVMLLSQTRGNSELFFRKQNSSERWHVQAVGSIFFFSEYESFISGMQINIYVCVYI